MMRQGASTSAQSPAAAAPPHPATYQQSSGTPPVPSASNSTAGSIGSGPDNDLVLIYSLLSMLNTDDKEHIGVTLLNMSTCRESCLAMRQAGCMSLLVQLIHGCPHADRSSRGSQTARQWAASAMHNLVHCLPDEKWRRREARVLKLLEIVRCQSDLLTIRCQMRQEACDLRSSQQQIENEARVAPAIAALMKLSFNQDDRQAITVLGGLQAVAELIDCDLEANPASLPAESTPSLSLIIRRFGCMTLTNLTYGDVTNKALLCSMQSTLKSVVALVGFIDNDDIVQAAGSVLRNLSWSADTRSKRALRESGAVIQLLRTAMAVKKEGPLKAVLSALWNMSAHLSENKADICSTEGGLEFLVSAMSLSGSLGESASGILRNISSYIAVNNEYRSRLRKHNCLQLLVSQLKSSSLTSISNACGALWNLSARNPTDQQALWDLGAVPQLKILSSSKHQMIATAAVAALRNLLAYKQSTPQNNNKGSPLASFPFNASLSTPVGGATGESASVTSSKTLADSLLYTLTPNSNLVQLNYLQSMLQPTSKPQPVVEQPTPMMFSRQSSVDSLESVEMPSIRSELVSEYTIESSPVGSKLPDAPLAQSDDEEEEKPVVYATEDTPAVLSHAPSLSNLTTPGIVEEVVSNFQSEVVLSSATSGLGTPLRQKLIALETGTDAALEAAGMYHPAVAKALRRAMTANNEDDGMIQKLIDTALGKEEENEDEDDGLIQKLIDTVLKEDEPKEIKKTPIKKGRPTVVVAKKQSPVKAKVNHHYDQGSSGSSSAGAAHSSNKVIASAAKNVLVHTQRKAAGKTSPASRATSSSGSKTSQLTKKTSSKSTTTAKAITPPGEVVAAQNNGRRWNSSTRTKPAVPAVAGAQNTTADGATVGCKHTTAGTSTTTSPIRPVNKQT